MNALKWKKSEWLYEIQLENGDNIILCNTTGQIAILNRELMEVLNSFSQPKSKDEIEIDTDIFSKLAEYGMIVEEGVSEEELFNKNIQKLKEKENYGFMYVVTMRCNMDCIYCFEDKTPIEMDQKIAKKCTEVLLERIRETGQKEVMINFYGGEPLLKFDLIKDVLSTVKEEVDTITTGVITNGTLLDAEKVSFLSQFQHPWAQITLDGPPEIHNQRRRYKDGKGTFDQVIKALERALEAFETVSLRINIDETNKTEIPKLFQLLNEFQLNKKNLFIDFGQVHTTAGPSVYYKSHCIATPPWSKTFAELLSLCKEYKYKPAFRLSSLIFCGAYHPKTIIFNPDGNLLSCWDGVGKRPEFVIGNVFNPTIYTENAEKFFNRPRAKKCKKCQIRGFCGGGCIAYAFAQTDDINATACPYYRYNINEIVKLYLDLCENIGLLKDVL